MPGLNAIVPAMIPPPPDPPHEDHPIETTRQLAQTDMEGQLLSWTDRMDAVHGLLERAGTETRDTLARELSELRRLESEGRIHLRKAEMVASAAWESTRGDILAGWRMIAEAFESGWIRIRSLTR